MKCWVHDKPPLPHLTCQVFGTGSGWRTEAVTRLCYQAPASIAACSGAQLPQNPPTGTRGVPAPPTLGRKANVLLVLEHQHKPRRGENNMLELMEEMKSDKWKQTDGKAFIKENHNLNSNRNKSNRPNQGITRKYVMKLMEMAGNWINCITIVGFDK